MEKITKFDFNSIKRCKVRKEISRNLDDTNRTMIEAKIKIQQAHDNFNNFFNTINDLLFVLDTEGNIIHMNNTACTRLEYSKEELIGKSVLLVHPEHRREEAGRTVNDMLSGKKDFCPIPIITKSGKEIPVETRVVIGEWNGNPALFGVVKDISDLKISEEKFAKAFHSNATLMAISTIDDGRYIEVNDSFLKALGFERNEVVGKKSSELDILVDKRQREQIKKHFEKYGKVQNIEVLIKGKNGCIHNGIFSVDNINFELGATKPCWITTMTDITEIKKLEEKILYLSYRDELTGLYNRRFYNEELEILDNENNLPITIVMGDLNGLKLINDSFGHTMGDNIIKKAAEVIIKGCRKNDIIARLGGDEFVIILPKTDSSKAEKIIKSINSLASKEKVGPFKISISLGYETKFNSDEKIQDIFKNAEDHMYKKKIFQSQSMRGSMIKSLINTLHEKNKREEQHSHRVSELCTRMGEALKLPEHRIEELKSVGLFHDIGKTAIDENILNKSGKLTADEWNEIKRHPEIGYRILNTVTYMADMAKYSLYHHERWDGTGYPQGLKGNEIPFVSRIIAIADTYDAMTSDRSYRQALSSKIAIDELKRNSGIQFDPELVKIFIEKVLRKI